MLLHTVFLIAGLLLLIGGGEVLVRGAVGLARFFGVSTLIVGLTVVAFGTSAPELAVNVLAALRGQGDLSFGNIVGSNIANIGLILGLTALLRPVDVHPSVVKRDIPIMLLATAAVGIMSLDVDLFEANQNKIVRGDGLILLAIFGMFLIFTVRSAVRESRGARREKRERAAELAAVTGGPAAGGEPPAEDPVLQEIEEEVEAVAPPNVGLAAVLTLLGLVGVVAGGELTVRGASFIAEAFGIPQVVIGLTIVAIGTSLPELVTCLVAVARGHSDIAVGNVVGSNIWNLLLILAVTSVVRAIAVPSTPLDLGLFTMSDGHFDLLVMAGLAAAVLPLSMRGTRRIGRISGGCLLGVYLAYLVFRTIDALP